MNLNKIVADFKKTQTQLGKYVEFKTSEILKIEETLSDFNNEKDKANKILTNINKLLGES